MSKSADAFRTISEVADWMDTPAHVLRFWESKFTQVKPVKRAGGRRYYRPADMRLLGGIKKLLHEDGMTIKGAQKILREKGIKHVASLCALSVGEDDDIDEIALEDVPMSDPVDTVVPFSKPVEPSVSPERESGDAEPMMDLSGDIAPAPTDAAPETSVDSAPSPEPEPTPVVADAIPPVEDIVAETSPSLEATVDAPEVNEAAEVAEVTALPGFLQRSMEERAEDSARADEIADTRVEPEEPAAEAESPVAVPVESVDPVVPEPEDPHPGALSMLAKITKLSPESAREIAPIVEKLRSKLA